MSELIIVGTDGSPAASAAVEWAADDAARRGCPLRFVSVVDRWAYGLGRLPVVDGDALTRHAERALAEAEAVVRQRQPRVEASAEIVEGLPAKVLRDRAQEAAEIVLGTRGLGGFVGLVVGSVSMHVAGQANCPVVVVRPGWQDSHGEVLVGVDDSAECEPALDYAFQQAELRSARVRALYAWQLPAPSFAPDLSVDLAEMRETQERAAAEKLSVWHRRHPELKVTEEVVYAHPAQALTEASERADLLVVGSHGRGALSSVVLGSVSRAALHHAHCPVAVVRSASRSESEVD